MKERILIIDELTPYIYFIKRVLINEGFEVKVTDSESEYMSYIKSESPELVLLDITLNNKLGLGYLKKIVKEFNNNPLVIVVTGCKELNKIELAFNYGAYDYLIKPLNLRDMKNKINQALQMIKKKENKSNA